MKIPDVREPFPGPKAQAHLERTKRAESPGDCTFAIDPRTVVEDRGEGVAIYDPDGNVFLDFMAGFGVVNTGHCHPRVVEAIKAQAEKLTHIMGAANTTRTELLELLTEVTPGDGPKKVQFGNSGAEAVEIAVKLARYYKRKSEIIAFHGAFHGRTYGALSLMTRSYARKGLYPMVPGMVHVPYAYCYRCPFDKTYPDCGVACAKFVEYTIKGPATAVTEPAAVIVEAVLGNGGMVPPPPEFLPELRRICDENDVLLIVDEVMSGWGRTGKWFASEHTGVEPDILVVGKGIAGGLPLSAAVAKAEITDVWEPNREGSTYSGNPIACAAAVASIGVYRDEELPAHAADVGAYFLDGLKALADEFPCIGEVRGLGLMIGVELVKDRQTREPLVNAGIRVAQICLRKGLLLYPACGHYNNVIAFLPPLVIERSHVDTAIEILREALLDLQKELGLGTS
ncbi:MAG: aspartate aminotransferase family protein [Gemmataceae bacterium]|nr:aspartate aminotransferase family protein [Gemmataceae bacterium]